ncbi:zinc finger and SCAN domain-containing protein 12-like [Condylostylus longicornis]|uniref:zinc finger and SCAN domain-containing protein 12-like n=1 Tax=Condylostylus longicornis TaxID=2530218 RepID=UPI00244DD336|nr:zinc finger and SCAN domain-containing protein 12-like [Condylostylus longicornis]
MEKYCRFCAEEKSNLSSICDINNEILDWLLTIIRVENDELPQKICYTCLCNVEEIGFFFQKCEESYKNLKKIYSENCAAENFKEEVLESCSDEYLEEEILSEFDHHDINNISMEINNEENDIFSAEYEDSSEKKDENIEMEENIIESIAENFDKKYECEYCHARFSNRSEKTNHKKTHNFFCTECGRNFTTKTKFSYHLANHKNQRNFKCRHCSKAFNHRSDLTNHLRFSHAGSARPRKYHCELCDKNYCTPTELKIHLRFHRNERPYKCHLCDHAYVIKGHLQQHLKKHADIKDKICDQPGCGKAYRDMSSLKKHLDIHIPDALKKYTCDVCDRKFSFFYILSDHRRKAHKKIAELRPLKKNEVII